MEKKTRIKNKVLVVWDVFSIYLGDIVKHVLKVKHKTKFCGLPSVRSEYLNKFLNVDYDINLEI